MSEKNLFQDSLPPDSVEIADEVSVKSLTSRTRSCWLRGHGVSTVVDYADTVFAKMLIFLECSISTFNLFLEKIKFCFTSVAQAAAELYNSDEEFKG